MGHIDTEELCMRQIRTIGSCLAQSLLHRLPPQNWLYSLWPVLISFVVLKHVQCFDGKMLSIIKEQLFSVKSLHKVGEKVIYTHYLLREMYGNKYKAVNVYHERKFWKGLSVFKIVQRTFKMMFVLVVFYVNNGEIC